MPSIKTNDRRKIKVIPREDHGSCSSELFDAVGALVVHREVEFTNVYGRDRFELEERIKNLETESGEEADEIELIGDAYYVPAPPRGGHGVYFQPIRAVFYRADLRTEVGNHD